MHVARFTLPENLAALDELLLKGDAWPATRPIMTLSLVLSRTPDAGRLEQAFEQATRAVPRMRQRVAQSPWAAGRASWVNDDHFDLSYHLRSIGAPGDGSLDAALAWVSSGATAPFDPGRPLWDAVLIERLAGDGSLVVVRAHHAIADGVRAIQMMAALLDVDPSQRQPQHNDNADLSRALSPNTAEMIRAFERAWVTNPRLANSMARSLQKVGLHPIDTLTSATAYVRSALRTLDRGTADPSPLFAARSPVRKFATLEVPLDAMKAAAKSNGAIVNDVYLTALLGGLTRYHQAFGLPAADFAVALPVDVSGANQHEAGNHISAAIIAGPASLEDPIARLRRVHDLVASRRAELGLQALDRLAPTLRQIPARLAIAAMGAHARRVDLQASNLVGPPCPLYLAGEKVETMFAFGPLPGVPAMGVLVSYNGMCTVGFTLDPAAVTDTALFVDCMHDAFEELFKIRDDQSPVTRGSEQVSD